VWESGNFAGKDTPPAWAANHGAPDPARVRSSGSFCAGMLNLAMRVNHKFIFQSTDLSWAGGVKWWQERLANHGVLQQSNRLNYLPGTLFLRRYTGAGISQQGHVAIMGHGGRLIQADYFGDAFDGINHSRTLYQTNQWLKYWDGGTFEFYINPAAWLK
jgi:hypothetical protein